MSDIIDILAKNNPEVEINYCSECGRATIIFLPHVNEEGKVVAKTCIVCFRENYESAEQ